MEKGHILYYPGGKNDINNDRLNAALKSKVDSVTKVTWQELKDLRDNSKLTPGALYRITDYQCTTTQKYTRSAGHQFDIVLLALSEDKLAEEGWAMMHDNIYNVTFADGVKKCWIYCYATDDDISFYNIVLVDTLLGLSSIESGDIIINEENKTAIVELESTDLTSENLAYNYFQNSNLSAWKVWYCLDNDKSRFAWADDSIDVTTLACITTTGNNKNFYRNKSGDVLGANFPYAWTSLENETKYTKLEELESGGRAIANGPNGLPFSVNITFTPGHEGTDLPNGHGVIYRLIDEWNNDVPYDFKNILYLAKVSEGRFDVKGIEEYIPTFCLYDNSSNEYKDASIFAIEYVNDERGVSPCYNNSINSVSAYNSPIDYTNKSCYALPCIIFLSSVESGSSRWATFDNKLISVYNSTFEGTCFTNIVLGSGINYIDLYNSFVYGSTRASMESI